MARKHLPAAILLWVAVSGTVGAQASPSAPMAIGETFTIHSRVLSETRRINVYLPPPYTATATDRFPVLYMPDGGMAEDFLHVAGLVQVSVGNGTMRPMVLVGIENTERRRDLTGPTTVAEDRRIAPRVGGSAEFRSFIRTELIPEIERRYRTTRERAIIGESLAGLFIMETLFLEPALFDTYIAFDPSLWWNSGELLRSAGERLRAGVGQGKSLFVASSSEPQIAPLVAALGERLRANAPRDLRWSMEAMPGETHGTIYHPAALLAVRRLFHPDSTRH